MVHHLEFFIISLSPVGSSSIIRYSFASLVGSQSSKMFLFFQQKDLILVIYQIDWRSHPCKSTSDHYHIVLLGINLVLVNLLGEVCGVVISNKLDGELFTCSFPLAVKDISSLFNICRFSELQICFKCARLCRFLDFFRPLDNLFSIFSRILLLSLAWGFGCCFRLRCQTWRTGSLKALPWALLRMGKSRITLAGSRRRRVCLMCSWWDRVWAWMVKRRILV